MAEDPIRARFDSPFEVDCRTSASPDQLRAALRAVLDILDDPPVPSRMLIPILRDAIVANLRGVTDV